MTAKLIAIEGSDGAGKATQTKMLVDYLRQRGIKVATIDFPQYELTPAGEVLYEYLKSDRQDDYCFADMNPKAASFLYAKNRFESMPKVQALINSHDVLVFDRWVESNILHQGGKFDSDQGKMDFAKWVSDLEYVHFGLPVPDVTVYLDLPYSISYVRARLRAEALGQSADIVESNLPYLKNSWKAGKLYASMFGWFVVDCVIPDVVDELRATYEFTPEEIHEKVKEVVKLTRKKLIVHD